MKLRAIPSPPPGYPDLRELLSSMKANIELLNGVDGLGVDSTRLIIQHAAPAKPVDGMIARADGGGWNPGGLGAGAYMYRDGVWRKLVEVVTPFVLRTVLLSNGTGNFGGCISVINYPAPLSAIPSSVAIASNGSASWSGSTTSLTLDIQPSYIRVWPIVAQSLGAYNDVTLTITP